MRKCSNICFISKNIPAAFTGYSSACDGALGVVSYDIDKNLPLNQVSFVMFDDYPNNEKSHVVQKFILKESNN